MPLRFRRAPEMTADLPEPSGGWYADPYGAAARRWYDSSAGWTDQVQGEGLEPDKTGMARVDDVGGSTNGGPRSPAADETPQATNQR
jgi:hypothetical protein